MNTCKTCRHWDGLHTRDNATCAVINAGDRSISAQALSDGGKALVFTKADFGCVYWEEDRPDDEAR